MSIFLKTNHLFLRNPRGGVEDCAAMAAAGFKAIFCNVGDHHPDEWDYIRQKAQMAGVVCGPWLRTADENNNWSYDRFRYLLDVADAWQTPLIVNSESELKGSGPELTTQIAVELAKRDAAISMEPWPFADVEWWPLAPFPLLPQIFPQDSETARDPQACRDQWYAYGINCVVYTFGSYGTQKPSDYTKLTPYGVYTADDCGNNFGPWAPQGMHKPCKTEDTNVAELIGDQDGISAMVNIFKEQWPDKTGKPDPNNIDTWKAIDKWERTMRILVKDHDTQIQNSGWIG